MEYDVLNGVWSEWKIVRKIGRGSFGTVYEAVRTDHAVESHAAIKVISIPQDDSEIDTLRSEGMSDDVSRTYLQGIVNDFVSEIQIMESFKGVQNIVSVEDYKVVEKTDEIGWNIYIRMELLTPLNKYVSDKTLSEREVVKLGVDICTALELCAKRNVIHRDIKPENIFINQFGDFKLGDFGIARKLENVTGGLSRKGTYNYMAPEIEKGNQYDATVDIYSLGLVLYRFLNKNRLPFIDTERQLVDPNERMEALNRRFSGEILPPPCQASTTMAGIILCACNPDPNKRFLSPTAMKNALLNEANRLNMPLESNNMQPINKTILTGESKEKHKTGKVKVPLIVIAVIIAAVIVAEGTYIVTKVVGKNNSGKKKDVDSALDVVEENIEEDNIDENNIEESTVSSDNEIINAAIEEAMAFAANDDYESALEKIKTTLVTYPQSEELLAKEIEYTDALTAQALEEADSLTLSGDYISAIDILNNAQDTYGEDAELSEKAQEYEDIYVSDVISNADELIYADKYTEASTLIDSALIEFPENQQLEEQKNIILSSIPKNFMDVCQPYEKNNRTYLYNGNSTFSMSGEQYRSGVVMELYDNGSWFLSNLKGEYSELQFSLGHVDNSGMADATLEIYLDGVLYQSYKVPSSGLPQNISISVSGVSQMKAVAYYDKYNGYPRIGLGDMKIKLSGESSVKQENMDESLYENLMDVCQPYEKNNRTYLYTGNSTFSMSGEQYRSGVVMELYDDGSWFLSNLKGEYSELQFSLGHVDNSGMADATLEIYLDDVLYQSYKVSSSGLPQNISIPVSDVSQMKAVAYYDKYNGYPRIGLANIMVK